MENELLELKELLEDKYHVPLEYSKYGKTIECDNNTVAGWNVFNQQYWVYEDDYFEECGFIVDISEEKFYFDTIEEVAEHFGVEYKVVLGGLI